MFLCDLEFGQKTLAGEQDSAAPWRGAGVLAPCRKSVLVGEKGKDMTYFTFPSRHVLSKVQV